MLSRGRDLGPTSSSVVRLRTYKRNIWGRAIVNLCLCDETKHNLDWLRFNGCYGAAGPTFCFCLFLSFFSPRSMTTIMLFSKILIPLMGSAEHGATRLDGAGEIFKRSNSRFYCTHVF